MDTTPKPNLLVPKHLQKKQKVENSESQKIWRAIRQIEANQQQIVNQINTWVAKIQGIDSVAFAAFALHMGKEFKLDGETVARTQEDIQKVLAEFTRYREEILKKREQDKNVRRSDNAQG